MFALLNAVQTQVPAIGGPIRAGAGLTPRLGRPSTGELTVLHQVIVAVLGQLPRITAPVLAAEVANTDLMMGGTHGAGSFLASLEKTLGGKFSARPATNAEHHKHRKAGVSIRA